MTETKHIYIIPRGQSEPAHYPVDACDDSVVNERPVS